MREVYTPLLAVVVNSRFVLVNLTGLDSRGISSVRECCLDVAARRRTLRVRQYSVGCLMAWM